MSVSVVSVVMPFKDAAGFLVQAASSVLAQSWPAVELVLVDDGGTDGSEQIAHRLAASDPTRVRVVTHAGRVNRGIGPSRRLGLTHARGDAVACLDADDVWEPSHVEHEMRLLEGSGADVVVCRAWTWRSWSSPSAPDTLSGLAFAPGSVVTGQRFVRAVLRDGGLAPPTCSVLARAGLLGDWLDALDGYPGMYEDQVLHSGLALRGSLALSGATSAWYRQHSTSISATELLDDDVARYDRGREQFLRWLQEQPQADDPGLRALVAADLAQLRERSETAAEALPPAQEPRPRRTSVLDLAGGRPRAAGVGVVRRLEGARDRWGSPARDAAAGDPAARARVERVLERNAESLHGRVLLLGPCPEPPAGDAVVTRGALPAPGHAAGPSHPLAQLPTASYDCLVVVDHDPRRRWSAADVRHLRRATAAGGVLVLALDGRQQSAGDAVCASFGIEMVHVGSQPEPASRRPPLQVVRAFVRA